MDTFPNPWDFNNTDEKLVSFDNSHKVIYYNLSEIAMGAPKGGQCFLETADKLKIKINDWCGGPPVWETNGQLLAIPIWTRKFLREIIQRIGVIDIKTKELRIYARTFQVLDLRSFDKKVIYGYDSPIYKTMVVNFDIEKAKIYKTIKLTK